MPKNIMKMRNICPRAVHVRLLALSLLAVPLYTLAQQTPATANSIPSTQPNEKNFDDALAPYFPADRPGATVIVTREGKTIFRKAYGLANIDS